MRLAREIRDALETDDCLMTREAESIIATKLGPVREALKQARTRFQYLQAGGVSVVNGITPAAGVKDLDEALALLEDTTPDT